MGCGSQEFTHLTRMTTSTQERADKIKAEANLYFNKNEFKKAIELYTQAIQIYPSNAIYYANRSFAYIKLEEYALALEDANRAIQLDPKYIKGYFRRGCCHLAMGKYPEALQDLQRVRFILIHFLSYFFSKTTTKNDSLSLSLSFRFSKLHQTTKMQENNMNVVVKNTTNSKLSNSTLKKSKKTQSFVQSIQKKWVKFLILWLNENERKREKRKDLVEISLEIVSS